MTSEEHPTTVDTLYLDLEHFALTAGSRPPLEQGKGVLPCGPPFPGLPTSAGPAAPAEEATP